MKKIWSRILKPNEIEEWLIGEREYMPREFGIGFNKTATTKKGDFTEFWYDEEELKNFEEYFDENFSEDKFHVLADKFIGLFYEEDTKLRQLVSAYTIFNVLDEYPEYMEGMDSVQRRLKRIRERTEEFGRFLQVD